MESSSETNQSSIQGYSTPPRSNNISAPLLSFRQPKLLTSSELKRRFTPIHFSTKKRRYNLLRNVNNLVPFERNLNMPLILPKLFDTHEEEEESSRTNDDCIVPLSSKIITRQPILDCLIINSSKIEQENLFSISENLMRQKLKILLEKN